jgi:hypothetical protein
MVSLTLLACTSTEALNVSYQVAYYTAAFAGAAVAAALFVEWRRRTLAWTPLYIGLLVLQPAWRLGYGEISHGWQAVSSDCGYGNRFIAVGLLAATLSALFILLARPDFSRRRFLLLLAAACWLVHLGTFLFLGFFYLPLWLPVAFAANTFVQAVIMAIEFGEVRLGRFTIILTLISAALSIPWSRLRQRGKSHSA